MPDHHRRFRLTDMDLTPILGVAGVGRLPPAQVPEFINQTHKGTDPGNLLMQMCQVLLAAGLDEFALEMQARALMRRRIYRVAGHQSPEVRLLALMGPGTMSDNTPLDFVVDRSPVRLDLLFVTPDQDLPEEIPDHDVLIVAIGESAQDEAVLARLERLLADWPRPVLNRPERIGRCARDIVCELLMHAPGLRIPPTRRMARGQRHSPRFPATIRPVDTHAGKGLEKIETQAELEAYLDAHLEAAYYLSDFIDYRSRDGLFRKYRIALIDGCPYVCHVALSDHWMVHYRSAGMQHSGEKRLEEAALMEAFERDFALRHATALRAIADALGLEYVVIDCAEDRDGQLLLFEADTRGWIHASDPIELFPYKPRIMQKAFDAFVAMLRHRMPDPLIVRRA
jgi:glutathione synthase/RimK-type ligase-like ATP-grasp enzyme